MKKFCIFLLTIFFLSVISPCQLRCGLVAQSVEHLTFNQRVMGSNPVGLTNERNLCRNAEIFLCAKT